jgi:hypothetical protein
MILGIEVDSWSKSNNILPLKKHWLQKEEGESQL